jgi:hypothetical protein
MHPANLNSIPRLWLDHARGIDHIGQIGLHNRSGDDVFGLRLADLVYILGRGGWRYRHPRLRWVRRSRRRADKRNRTLSQTASRIEGESGRGRLGPYHRKMAFRPRLADQALSSRSCHWWLNVLTVENNPMRGLQFVASQLVMRRIRSDSYPTDCQSKPSGHWRRVSQ